MRSQAVKSMNWTSPRRDLNEAVWLLTLTCAVLVVIGSLASKSQRFYGEPGAEGSTIATEGVRSWAVLTFFGDALAIGTLVAGRRWPRGQALLTLVATASFWGAAFLAGQRWQHLLDARARPREYAREIALGVPLVTVAGALGGAIAVSSAIWTRGRPTDRHYVGSTTRASEPPSTTSGEIRRSRVANLPLLRTANPSR
jgi:hypothetical protein